MRHIIADNETETKCGKPLGIELPKNHGDQIEIYDPSDPNEPFWGPCQKCRVPAEVWAALENSEAYTEGFPKQD